MTKQGFGYYDILYTSATRVAPPLGRLAYYRHSAQDRQKNSIPIQGEKVRQWADENGFDIIHEFADAGKSGLNAEAEAAPGSGLVFGFQADLPGVTERPCPRSSA